MLSAQVIGPVSLQQILMEQNALEDAETVQSRTDYVFSDMGAKSLRPLADGGPETK